MHWDTRDSPAPVPFAARVTEGVKQRFGRSRGRGCRPAYGTSFGRNTTEKYAEELLEFYKNGAQDKKRKIGSPRIIERLQAKYPMRYDIPSEIHVIQFISALNVKWKKLQEKGRGIEDLKHFVRCEKGGKRMTEKYVSALKGIV